MSTAETALMKAGAQPSLIKDLAEKYGVDAGKFYNTVVTTVFPSGKAKNGEEARPGKGAPPTEAMVMTFLIVCNQYDLNPFLREIYPFIDGEGNLKIVVGVDGWIKTALRQSQYDGHEFSEHIDADGKLFAVTCSMYRKDRTRPIKMIEYMAECKMGTKPWEQWPHRMLHHKAFIQSARYAFGMGSIIDDDEAERIRSVNGASHTILEEPRRLSDADKPALAPPPTQSAAPAVAAEPEATSRTSAPATSGEDGPLTEADIKSVWELAFHKNLGKVDVNGMVKKKFGVDRVQGLRKSQLAELLEDIRVF